MEDLNTTILTNNENRRIIVDEYSDDSIWLSMQLEGASFYTSMSFEQAQQLIEAINKVMEAQNVKAATFI